jgi:hypothetical protein
MENKMTPKTDYKPMQEYFDEMTTKNMKIDTTSEQIKKFLNGGQFSIWFKALSRFELLVFYKYSKLDVREHYDGFLLAEVVYIKMLIDIDILVGSVTGNDFEKYSFLRTIEFDGLPDSLEEVAKLIDKSFMETVGHC